MSPIPPSFLEPHDTPPRITNHTPEQLTDDVAFEKSLVKNTLHVLGRDTAVPEAGAGEWGRLHGVGGQGRWDVARRDVHDDISGPTMTADVGDQADVDRCFGRVVGLVAAGIKSLCMDLEPFPL